MLKLQRNYRAEFEIGERHGRDLIPRDKLTVSYPFSCQFHISSGTYQTQNRGVFQLVNLSRNDQARLWLDMWNFGKKYIYMKFYAGYGENMPLVFSGYIQNCTSEKQGGSTEFITEILASASTEFYEYGFLNATFTKGTTLKDILGLATSGSGKISVGYITPDIEPLPRNKTFIGQTLDLLGREYGGYNIFIDNDEINILGDRDLIPGEVLVISDESGLLGSPRRANAYVECDMLFEPQIRAGQGVTLLSYTQTWLNQSYRVVKIEHKGVISPVVSGKLITSLTLSILPGDARTLTKATQTVQSGVATTGQWQKPVQGSISSPFGRRTAPIKGASTNHQGIDIAVSFDTPVNAPANGKVITTGWIKGYGKTIIIDHGIINGKTVTSLYGHLNNWLVNPGQNVYTGNHIGLVGSTGNSKGPHLHFEVREGKEAVNPARYIGNY